MIPRPLPILALITAIIALDRASKHWALSHASTYAVNDFLTFQLHFNRGISWGMFHQAPPIISLLLSLLIFCFITMFVWYTYAQYKRGEPIIGELCVIAGACSNLFDRVWYVGVIDFIVCSWGTWMWPVFNIADAAIVVGLGAMLVVGWKKS